MDHLRLLLFGPPRLEEAGEAVALRPRKAMALFAYLAMHRQSHSRDTLATLLWPESSQQNARASLRRTLYEVRQVLPADTLSVTTETIEIDPQADLWVDVIAFQQCVEECLPADPAVRTPEPACVSRLEEAAELYTDAFMSGFTLLDSVQFDDWQTFQRESLQRALTRILEQLVQYYGTQARYQQAITYARRWLNLDPLHESVHRELMTLYAWSGQRGAALRQYQECERILQEEMGVEPAEETLHLLAAIKEGNVQPPSPAEVESAGTSPGVGTPVRSPIRYTLPRPATPFVGRETELTEISRLLNDPDCRLLTLVGPGGIGKTRLALKLATRWRDGDAAAFVDLQPVQSAEFLVPAIIDALNLTHATQDDPREQLIRYLADKEILLVFDNFEHLVDGAVLLSEILQACPGITLLITSRVVLKLQEEWQYLVEGLQFPESDGTDQTQVAGVRQYDAVQLFLACARRVRSDFQLDAEEDDVARLCRLVEGMPLAIELAATWTKILSPAEIVNEIQRDLTFLSSSVRNVPDKHRSVTVVFERSWALASPEQRDVFQRLSVFRSGFDRDAAREVAGASLSILGDLVDTCLLRWHSDGRYQIHELLRQHAEEQLARTPAALDQTRDLHCTYYTTFLADRFDDLSGGRQREALAEIRTELENVRTAWRWAVQQARVDDLERAAMPLHVFYTCQSRFREGADAFAQATEAVERLPQSRERDRALAALYTCSGWLNMRLGHVQPATRFMEQAHALHTALDIAPSKGMGTDPLTGLTILAGVRGSYDEAIALGRNARQAAAARGDTTNVAFACYGLAQAALAQGRYDEALQYARETLVLTEETGNRWFQNYVYQSMGRIAQALGDTGSARTYYRTSYTIGEEFGSAEAMGVAATHLGDVALLEQAYAAAYDYYQQSAVIYEDIGNRRGQILALAGLGVAAHALGDETAARQHLRQSLTVADAVQVIPLTLSALFRIGTVLVESGDLEHGFAALRAVAQHAATDRVQKDRARELLEEHADEWVASSANDSEVELQELVATLLAQLQAPSGQAESTGRTTVAPLLSGRVDLPIPPTRFIGRERELAEIGRLLDDPDCRLLTLAGPGGIGKTRTALEVARIHRAAFADGTAYVSLTSLQSAGSLVPAIADALGYVFSGPAHTEQQLIHYLRDKELLLVLDNFEHLLDGATVLTAILSEAPAVTLLVTSRERLNLRGEWVYTLDGLPIPDEDATEQNDGAVALFAESAGRLRHDFRITPANRRHVLDICRMVGGMPLAIELAAAWIRVLSTADIAAEIARSLDFLSASSRDVPDRHRSIRAVFEHSWKLLSVEEQRILARLSVFRGQFDRVAAETVVGATLPRLSALVDKSLIRRAGAGRYSLHDLLRQYAHEQLRRRPNDLNDVTERHARYFATYLERCAPALRSDAQLQTVADMAENLENLRQAWDWMVTKLRTDLIRRCVASLWYFYELRGRLQEGLDVFKLAGNAIEMQSEDERDWVTYIHVLNQQSWFHMRLGQDAEADSLLKRAHMLLADVESADAVARADAYLFRSFSRYTHEEWELSRADVECALPLYQEAGDRVRVAFCHSHLGRLALSLQQYRDAYTHFETSLAISRRTGALHALISTTASLGVAAMYIGRFEEAQNLLQESLSLGETLQYRWGIGNALRALGFLHLEIDDVAGAIEYFHRSAAIFAESADLLSYIVTLFHLGNALRDEPAEAKKVLLDARHQAKEIASAEWVDRIDEKLASLQPDLT